MRSHDREDLNTNIPASKKGSTGSFNATSFNLRSTSCGIRPKSMRREYRIEVMNTYH